MIGSKVVLTYKRKRLPSRPGLGFENEQTHGYQTLEVLKASVHEEEESVRKDAKTLNLCALYNGTCSNVLQKCGYCHCSCDVKGHFPSSEDLDEKKLCSRCVQRDSLSTLEKVENSCEDTMEIKKPGFPLITFSRRLRQKNTVEGTSVQGKSTAVEKYDLLAAKSTSAVDNGCLLDLSTDLTGNDSNCRNCTASQEKETIEDVEICDVDSLSAPNEGLADFSSEKSTNEELTTGSCVLKDTQLLAESSADAPQILSNEDAESAKITVHMKQDEVSLASFDLSKPPHESGGLVDYSLTLKSSSNIQLPNNVSENHRESTDFTSRSHSVVLPEFPSRSRVLELLDDRIGETSLSQLHYVPPRLSSSSHMWGPDLPSTSIGQSQTSKKNFLQLFPEDNFLPSKGTSVMHPQSNPTSNRNPLHFRIESRNSANFKNMIGVQYPSDTVSLMRHKMMLDNILSKARTGSIKKGNFSDTFDHPNVWSEEELDFLWIGVRRHGMGSWDAILRDPRLHFSSWRSPRELAERWEEEQSNLLRKKPFKSTKKHNPILVDEPQLSLGTVDPFLVNGYSNLPHWLREAVTFPASRPIEQGEVSYTGHSGLMHWINQPFCGSNTTMGMSDRRGPVLQPTSRWAEPLVQAVAPHPVSSKADEVIVINSDASSEETISDDHSVLARGVCEDLVGR